MPKSLSDVLAWSKTHQGKKLIRYTLSSVITTAISFSTIVIVYGFHIISGIIAATLCGNLVAVIPSYYLSRAWAWGKRGRTKVRSEVLPFLAMSLSGSTVALFGATYARHVVHAHHWAHLINTAVVGGTNIASFGVFWVLKMLLFNRIFRPASAQSLD